MVGEQRESLGEEHSGVDGRKHKQVEPFAYEALFVKSELSSDD